MKLLNLLNLEQRTGLKQTMMQAERITPTVKLNLRLYWWRQVFSDYSDAYIYVKETKTVPGQGADAAT